MLLWFAALQSSAHEVIVFEQGARPYMHIQVLQSFDTPCVLISALTQNMAAGAHHRLCGTVAIAIWTATGDPDHVWLVGSYYHYSVPGGWTEPKALDISPRKGIFGGGDPMYVVFAHKQA